MDNREIAKELAVAFLSHENLVAAFRPKSTNKADATEAGERIGELYNAIWRALQQESLASAKGPTAH